MSGKRLLDAARLYGALKSVASSHYAIRSQQLDTFVKTSTLAKAFKNQTDRVTVTAGAAFSLAKKLAEDAPAGVRARGEVHDEGIHQDHHYSKPEGATVQEKAAAAAINVQQETAARYPLPDGTVPPPHTGVRGAEDTFSQRPESEAPKDPLAGDNHADELDIEQKAADRHALPDGTIPPSGTLVEQTDTGVGSDTFNDRPGAEPTKSPIQAPVPSSKIPEHTGNDEGAHQLGSQSLNQDVYYSASGSESKNAHERQDAPEDVNVNVFHSPRVASLLQSGGKDDRREAYRRKMDEARKAARSSQPIKANATTMTTIADKEQQAEAEDTKRLAETFASEVEKARAEEAVVSAPEPTRNAMHESRVPASRLSRIWQFGGLATSMAFGAVGETFKRVTGGASDGSIMLSEANMNRLVAKLSRMRGAALKLGQMMSFQDSKLLPPAINAVLQRVQDSADYMPPSQRDMVLSSNLGESWHELFSSFDDVPVAAASIGQVHRAVLASNGHAVAVKVQYPGVKGSIDSDLSNLSLLLTASRLLPKGLYLDKTIANARTELAWECDYVREAECGKRFAELLSSEQDVFTVPKVYDEACGPEVLTAEFMPGKGVSKIKDLTQDERDWIGTQILRLCLRELMEWKYMQTDPNWTNFLYNRDTKKLELLDFGATREFPLAFVRPYVELLEAASRTDRETCREKSIELGYLTGHESKTMLDAHVDSILTLAEPFMAGGGGDRYDFRDQTITDRVRAKIGIMVRERLAPPPEETYSLHRKLSGAFLLCARLGSRVRTREMFEAALVKWRAGGAV